MSSKIKEIKPIDTAWSLEIHRIAVIDESYTHPGLCVWDVDACNLLNFQEFSYEKAWNNKSKRVAQMTAINALVLGFSCDAVIVEEARMFPSAQTKARLHEIIATIANGVSVPVYEVNTTSWKALTVGHRATKEQTVEWVKDTFHVEVDDDVSDAICIGSSVCRGVKLKRFY